MDFGFPTFFPNHDFWVLDMWVQSVCMVFILQKRTVVTKHNEKMAATAACCIQGQQEAQTATAALLSVLVSRMQNLQLTFDRLTCYGANPVWVGDWALPQDQQGLVALGTPLGTDAFVQCQLRIKRAAQDRLLERIPHVDDLQASWLLLRYCAAPRANYLLRVLPPRAQRGIRRCSRHSCRSVPGPASRLCGRPAAGRGHESSPARGAAWGTWLALREGRSSCGTLGLLVRRAPCCS